MIDLFKISILFILAFFYISSPSMGQIVERPLSHNPLPGPEATDPISTRSADKLTLPFADDFSADDPYPNPDYWMDRQVYINNNLPLNPPSYGVATFDGLDEYGLPYGGGYGGSDTLTSQPFDLSRESKVYLSYYLQPKGIAFIPQLRDSFVVEGLDRQGTWQVLASYEGLEDAMQFQDAPEFQRASVSLDQRFLHDQFQFRFRNYGPNRGMEALWHLDYVMLTREEPDRYIEDISFVKQPGFLVKRYSAYPLSHLQLNPEQLNNKFPIHLRNNSRNRYTIDSSQARIVDVLSGEEIFLDRSLLEIPPIVEENQRNIDPGSVSFINTFNTANMEDYLLGNPADKITLATEYNYIMREERDFPSFEQNNHVRRETVFDNYFAYDDNTVEGSISTYNGRGITTRIAVEYELAKEDSLQAIRIIFPYLIQDYEHKSFNLLIFIDELKSDPDYILRDLQPKRGNSFQPFTEYQISDYIKEGILLPAGKVYVGWEHPRGTDKDYIPVGFDKNRPEASAHIYYNLGGEWLNVAESNPDLQGAVAMRLVVGQTDFLTHNAPTIEDLSAYAYPNPVSEEIRFKSMPQDGPWEYQIFSINGQLRQSGTLRGDRIRVPGLEPGYFTLLLRGKDKNIFGRIRFIKH